jgi:hypothetical protein
LRLFFPTLPFLVSPIGDPTKRTRRRKLIIESAAVALRRLLVKVPAFLVAFIVSFGGLQIKRRFSHFFLQLENVVRIEPRLPYIRIFGFATSDVPMLLFVRD